MGILPMQFKPGVTRKTLGLTGDEIIDIALPAGVKEIKPSQDLVMTIHRADGKKQEVTVTSRLNTDNEIEYFKSGGILQYVLNNLARNAA